MWLREVYSFRELARIFERIYLGILYIGSRLLSVTHILLLAIKRIEHTHFGEVKVLFVNLHLDLAFVLEYRRIMICIST